MINQDHKQSEALKREIQEFELSVLAGQKDEKYMDVLGDVGNGEDVMCPQSNNISKVHTPYRKEGMLDKNYRNVLQRNER